MEHNNLTPAPSTPDTWRSASQRIRARRSVADLLAHLPRGAAGRANLISSKLPEFVRCGASYSLPKFLFVGPPGGDSYIRVGLFAGIHGDEIAGSIALVELITALSRDPSPIKGFELFIYPVCNPSGYEDDTRWPRGGNDLNREFWKDAATPEVQILEAQLRGLAFDGIVSLHADDTSEGVYGFTGGDVLTKNLLYPALNAAAEFLPVNLTPTIDGFPAEDGIISEGYRGILSAPPEQAPRPFEIIFETPQLAPLELQVAAHLAALHSIFREARLLKAHAANI